MSIKLFDSELKIMNVLWQEGDCTAKYISDVLKEETGWNMIPKEEVQEAETNELINKVYDGSVDKLFAALLGKKKLSKEQIKKLKDIVNDLD